MCWTVRVIREESSVGLDWCKGLRRRRRRGGDVSAGDVSRRVAARRHGALAALTPGGAHYAYSGSVCRGIAMGCADG